jgi:hypothetical protein
MKRKGTQFEQQSMFDSSSYDTPAPTMNHDPEAWATRADIVHHTSDTVPMPEDTGGGRGYGPGFHVGTLRSALDRRESTGGLGKRGMRDYVHPLRMEGQTALRPEEHSFETESYPPKKITREADPSGDPAHPTTWNDWDANYVPGTNAVKAGFNVPYSNAVEDKGSVSFRSPRQNLNTWAEDVAADPGASRGHKLMAEQFDFTVPVGTNSSNQSGQVIEQPTLPGIEGDTQVSGQSELHVLRPKMKRKEQP